MGSEFGFLIAFFAIFYLLFLGAAILMYVLQSLALFNLAKKRGIQNYGLAWVPIGSSWILGKLADDVNICRRNKRTHFARNLLVLNIAYLASFVLVYIGAFALGITIAMEEMMSGVASTAGPAIILVAVLLWLVLVALIIAIHVLFYMALYRVFYGYAEENAVIFTVLSIFFSILLPIFLFVIRNRELLPPDPTTFVQNGYPVYPDMYSANPNQTNENNFENNSNNGGQY